MKYVLWSRNMKSFYFSREVLISKFRGIISVYVLSRMFLTHIQGNKRTQFHVLRGLLELLLRYWIVPDYWPSQVAMDDAEWRVKMLHDDMHWYRSYKNGKSSLIENMLIITTLPIDLSIMMPGRRGVCSSCVKMRCWWLGMIRFPTMSHAVWVSKKKSNTSN